MYVFRREDLNTHSHVISRMFPLVWYGLIYNYYWEYTIHIRISVNATIFVTQPSSLLSKTVIVSKTPVESAGPTELWEDDLAGKIQNEYDPMVPNNYEIIVKQKRAEDRSRDNEVGLSFSML